MTRYVVLTEQQARCILALADETDDRTIEENDAFLDLADQLGLIPDIGTFNRPRLVDVP